jgi:energy-coupling factor transport system permease protein
MRALKDITLGQYYPGDSPVHHLDPRAKLFISLIIVISLFSRNGWVVILVWGSVFVIALYQSRIPAPVVLKNLRPFRWLFAITIVLNILYTPQSGAPLFRFLGVSPDIQAINVAFLNTFRLVFFIVFSALLTLTTSPLEITDALDRMLKPLRKFRLPVQEIALMVSIAMRFIPTILQEADRIRKAQISRGADFSGSITQRVRALIPLTLPLFLSTFQRAEELATAMEARCFDTNANRTQYARLTWSRVDTLLIIVVIITGVILVL